MRDGSDATLNGTKWQYKIETMVLIKQMVCLLFACLIAVAYSWSQSNSLFSGMRNYQTMSERWELDSATRRGVFLI